MAIVFDGPVTPDALTAFVRNVPTPDTFALNQILPDRFFSKNTIDFASITKTNRTAKFRAFDGRLHVSERDVTASSQVKLPPLSSSLSTGELERLQIEFARMQGGNTQALVDAIYDDATNLTREIQARMELARGDVLTDGKFTLAGEGGLYMEADFAIPSGNITTAGVSWATTASADPITDMLAVVDTYVATNGFAPGGIVLSRATVNYLLRNSKILALAASLNGVPGLVTRPVLDQALASYGIPPIALVYDTQVDVDGTTTRVLPANKVLFLPPNVADLGYTAWGVTATSLELMNSSVADSSFELVSGIVGVVEKVGPPYREFVFVDAVGMPVLAQPKLLSILTV